MKKTNFTKILFILSFVFMFTNCESILDSPPYSQLSESTLNTENGINSLLNSAYSGAQLHFFRGPVEFALQPALTTGKVYNVRGSFNRDAQPFSDFLWLSSSLFLNEWWNNFYSSIRDANLILANMENKKFSPEFKKDIMGQAKFIRAWCYVELYNRFGTVPLHKSPSDDIEMPRAPENEMKVFIEQELKEAADLLPVKGEQFGRATKGAALGVLCKFYLNTKQWQKAVNTATDIMSMGKYGLIENYADIFSLENEGNKELIWTLPYSVSYARNTLHAFVFPKDYAFKRSNLRAYSTTTYAYDSFVNSFSDKDERKKLFITQYNVVSGEIIQGLGNNLTIPGKYPLDPNADGANAGNDIPAIRYADILLSRAEALNELHGPTPEAIKLLNEVRERAGLLPLKISDFNKESLRDKIFECRKKEFWLEGKGRLDEIRQGTFISNAQSRGLNAQPYQKLFPIPQTEIDANSKIKQNPGY